MFSNKSKAAPRSAADWKGYALTKDQQRKIKGGTDGTTANEFLITEDIVAV